MRLAKPQHDKLSNSRKYWELLSVLTKRNLKQRYRGSFLGVYWSLLNPLTMTAIYTAVLGAAFASYYQNSLVNYILAAFTGLTTIHFFAAATTQSLRSVVSNGMLLNKVRIPMSIFPASAIAANLFQFGIATLPLLMLMAFLNSGNLFNSLALLLPLLALVLFSTGTGFFLSSLYVFYRDIPYFYELIVYSLRIATPIFYPAEIVPEKIRYFILLNPLAQIIESIRQITLSGENAQLGLISSALFSSVIVCVLGCLFFEKLRHQFMDLL